MRLAGTSRSQAALSQMQPSALMALHIKYRVVVHHLSLYSEKGHIEVLVSTIQNHKMTQETPCSLVNKHKPHQVGHSINSCVPSKSLDPGCLILLLVGKIYLSQHTCLEVVSSKAIDLDQLDNKSYLFCPRLLLYALLKELTRLFKICVIHAIT